MARVLVVDDDEVLLTVTVALLEEYGYVSTGTAQPARALSALSVGAAFDLLITDVRMPLMPGPELALRARELCPDLPVIYMSGVVIGVPGGHFLPKPFTGDQLIDAVRHALERGTEKHATC